MRDWRHFQQYLSKSIEVGFIHGETEVSRVELPTCYNASHSWIHLDRVYIETGVNRTCEL